MTMTEIMRKRLCFPISITDTIENVIGRLLDENVLCPKDSNRKMPLDGFASKVSTSGIIRFRLDKHENLYKVIDKLCVAHGLKLELCNNTIILSR